MPEQRWAVALGRVLAGAALFCGAWAIWFLSGSVLRMLCGVATLVFSCCVVAYSVGRARGALLISGLVVALTALSPVEVSLATRTGLPGIVPVLRGLPGPAARERARRGEVLLAGCMVTGFEPRWVVIW